MKTRKIEILIVGVFLSATSLLQAQDSLATVYLAFVGVLHQQTR
jgi:hypothetical protein